MSENTHKKILEILIFLTQSISINIQQEYAQNETEKLALHTSITPCYKFVKEITLIFCESDLIFDRFPNNSLTVKFLFIVVCSSVSVDDPIANGVIGQKIYLRWYFTITKDDTVNQIQVYINETKAKFEILNGISPILQDYGMKLFKDRLFATFSRNVYTIALQNLRLNDTYRFVLLAQFAKKENVKDIKFSEVFIKIADVICKYHIASFLFFLFSTQLKLSFLSSFHKKPSMQLHVQM